jgi:hypothetical protein
VSRPSSSPPTSLRFRRVQVSRFRRTTSGLVSETVYDSTFSCSRSPPRPSTPVLTPPALSSSSAGDSRVVPFETPTLLFDPG